jgi:FimV-like protein
MSFFMLPFPRTRAFALGFLGVALLVLGGCQATLEDRLAEARAMQEVGEFEQSIEPLQELLQEAPDHPEANLRLGFALMRVGQGNRALWPLQRAAEDPELGAQANLNLAQLYMSFHDFDGAVKAVDRVLEAEPEQKAALQLRYKANLEAKRREEALEDLGRLLALTPDDPELVFARAVTLAELGRIEEAEAAHRDFIEVAEASGQAGLPARACTMLSTFFRDNADDPERAEKELLRCDEQYPDDPFIQRNLLQMYDDLGREDDALALMRRLHEENPDDLGRRVQLARRLDRAGNDEEAEALMEAASEAGPAGKLALARFYEERGDAETALKILEPLIEEVGGVQNEEARFQYVDLLIRSGKLEQAREVAEGLEDPTYRQVVAGSLLLREENYAEAFEALDAAVTQWPNNPGVRYMAGYAAYRLGLWDQAVAHLREAVRSGSGKTDAGLLLAQLYLERNETQDAARFARQYTANQGKDKPDGYVVLANAQRQRGISDDTIEGTLMALEEAGFPLEAAVERAKWAREREGSAAAVRSIEQSGLDLTDPANEAALRVLAEDLSTLNRNDEALARVAAAAAAHPDATSLAELRGSVLLLAGQGDQARASFERALELDPGNSRALLGLGTLAGRSGDVPDAIALLDRAVEADPTNAEAAYAAAQLTLAAGRTQEAEQRLRAVLRMSAGHAASRNDLAWILASEQRDLDLALELAQLAAAIDPHPTILDTLGYVRLQRGESQEAVTDFERALAQDPENPSVRYHLGLALAGVGETRAAAEAFQTALDKGPFPEADAARRELARMQTP